MTPTSQAEQWADAALERLARAGYRRGSARRALLVFLGQQACAVSAIDIEAALSAGARRVSRASIYRILDELEQVHLVQRVGTGAPMARYEPIRTGHEHHHHLVCDRCGRLEPFTDEALERAISALSRRVPLDVSEHEVILHGACDTCATNPGQ